MDKIFFKSIRYHTDSKCIKLTRLFSGKEIIMTETLNITDMLWLQ